MSILIVAPTTESAIGGTPLKVHRCAPLGSGEKRVGQRPDQLRFPLPGIAQSARRLRGPRLPSASVSDPRRVSLSRIPERRSESEHCPLYRAVSQRPDEEAVANRWCPSALASTAGLATTTKIRRSKPPRRPASPANHFAMPAGRCSPANFHPNADVAHTIRTTAFFQAIVQSSRTAAQKAPDKPTLIPWYPISVRCWVVADLAA